MFPIKMQEDGEEEYNNGSEGGKKRVHLLTHCKIESMVRPKVIRLRNASITSPMRFDFSAFSVSMK